MKIKKNSLNELNKILIQKNKYISELKEENYRLKSILEKLPGSIYYKDIRGVYLYCNDFVLEMANLDDYDEILNKTDFDLPWKEYANEIRKLDEKVINSKVPLEIEEYPIFNNKKLTMLTRKTPFFDEKGNITGIIGISLDITERKRLEENLKNRSDQAKSEFLQNMRHDIHTPLMGIVRCAEILKSINDPSQINEYANDLIQSSNALLDFLTRILEGIKVATGEIPLLKKKFNLRQQLEVILNLNRALAAEKKLSLCLSYDENISNYVIGDPFRIERIVLELITNALTFTQKGIVNLNVKLKKKEGKQLVIEIIVKDTGIGIPKAQQEAIFQRFKRLTPSHQGIYKGLGLGLTTVKQFIEDLEGEIYVSSELGHGTTFTCLFAFKEPLLMDGIERKS